MSYNLVIITNNHIKQPQFVKKTATNKNNENSPIKHTELSKPVEKPSK